MAAKGTRAEFLRVARGELGKGPYEVPHGSNSTRYGREYGLNPAMWCNMYVWWVCKHSGVTIVKSAYTPHTADWFRRNHRWFPGDQGRTGDCVFFNFPNDNLHRISHIGIVLKKLGPGRYLTIEGNVGGKVGTHERTMRSIVGFGRLKFAANGAASAASAAASGDKPAYRKGGLRAGSTGDRVTFLQRRLNQIAGPRGHKILGFKPLKVTGTFDPDTEKVVKVFQANRGLESSGIVGPKTWARL